MVYVKTDTVKMYHINEIPFLDYWLPCPASLGRHA